MSELCMRHIESVWKEKTDAANQLFKEGKYKEALTGYKEALFRAEVLNHHKSEAARLGIPFMQIFAISCNNVAFNYEEMGEIKQCKKMLERVIYYFLFLIEGGQADDPAVQNELKRAFFTYKDFSVRCGVAPQDQQTVFGNIQGHFTPSSTV